MIRQFWVFNFIFLVDELLMNLSFVVTTRTIDTCFTIPALDIIQETPRVGGCSDVHALPARDFNSVSHIQPNIRM